MLTASGVAAAPALAVEATCLPRPRPRLWWIRQRSGLPGDLAGRPRL